MAIPKRVLITGARGLLGTPTTTLFRAAQGVEVSAVGHLEFDITDEAAVRRHVDAFRPDLVINCAAFTKVDACEEQHALADRVNGYGAGIVAAAAAAHGARLIHVSTDYVFDGQATRPYREDHPTGNPRALCAYGRSKLLGEQRVAAAHPAAIIVRTAWVYGEDGPCFPRTILRLAGERPLLRVVSDQTGSPTYARDLAGALFELARTNAQGVFHVTNAGQCTWFEFAREIVMQAGLGTPVEPIATEDYPLPARRPKYSVLDNGRYVTTAGRPLRPWREALSEYLRRAS